MKMRRLKHINCFYQYLEVLGDKLGGYRYLNECHGNMDWPRRGIYFFFEHGERRSNDLGFRVMRVGTHALKRNSNTTFWSRLRAHRGTLRGRHPSGGNHRGSIFRLHVGAAILRKEGLEEEYPTWGKGSSAKRAIRNMEYPIEREVSQYIGAMPFLWLEVDDSPGPQSKRGYLERNSIALLSNYGRLGTSAAIDPPSPEWLGAFSLNDNVQKSGLWNSDHTNEDYEPNFLKILEYFVERM